MPSPQLRTHCVYCFFCLSIPHALKRGFLTPCYILLGFREAKWPLSANIAGGGGAGVHALPTWGQSLQPSWSFVKSTSLGVLTLCQPQWCEKWSSSPLPALPSVLQSQANECQVPQCPLPGSRHLSSQFLTTSLLPFLFPVLFLVPAAWLPGQLALLPLSRVPLGAQGGGY